MRGPRIRCLPKLPPRVTLKHRCCDDFAELDVLDFYDYCYYELSFCVGVGVDVGVVAVGSIIITRWFPNMVFIQPAHPSLAMSVAQRTMTSG
jgi:hypothetical protein